MPRDLMKERAQRQRGVTRRIALASVGAVALGATLVGGRTVMRVLDQPAGKGLEALSTTEHAIVQRIAETWMPPGAGPPDISGAEADCGGFLDMVVDRLPADKKRLMKLLLHIINETPWYAGYDTMLEMDRIEAAPHLKALMESEIFYLRQGVGALMALIALGYTTHPDVAPVLRPWFTCGFGR